MEISQELEDKLVGIAVVKGYWHAAAYYLDELKRANKDYEDNAVLTVFNISRKYPNINLPMTSPRVRGAR